MSQSMEMKDPFERIDAQGAKKLIDEGKVTLIDVREPVELAQGKIPNSTLIPLNTLLMNPANHLTQDNVIFYCAEGIRSALVCEMAAAMGRSNIYNLEGGLRAWTTLGLPVEK